MEKTVRKVTLREMYEKFPRKDEITFQRYKAIHEGYSKYLINKLLEGYTVHLPSRMGAVRVLGKKQTYRIAEDGTPRGLAPNWKATMDYRKEHPDSKKVIYHMNPETDGVRYKIRWSRYNVFARNKKFYNLRFCRAVKNKLSALIKSKAIEFEVV